MCVPKALGEKCPSMLDQRTLFDLVFIYTHVPPVRGERKEFVPKRAWTHESNVCVNKVSSPLNIFYC